MGFEAKDLEDYIREHIPVGRFMEISVERLDESGIVLQAPLAPSVNDKGSAFGGSLFSLAVLTGWGFTFSLLRREGLEVDVVVQKSEIRFLSQATGPIRADCDLPEFGKAEEFIASVKRGEKGRWDLEIGISHNGERCATMTARYYGWLKAA